MDLDDVRLFLEVTKAQSISQGAARLHMGQPTMSQRIAALERELGQALFHRHRRGVELTEAGAVLFEYAERLLRLMAEAEEKVRNTPLRTLQIRIAAPASVNSYVLPPYLNSLIDAGHDIEVRDAHSHEVMQAIFDGTVDVGFVIDTPRQPGITRQPIITDAIVCVAAPSHPIHRDTNGQTTKCSLADLVEYSVIFYRFSFDYDGLVARIKSLRKLAKSNVGLVELTPAETVKNLVVRGAYISFLPKTSIRQELEQGSLREIAITDLPTYTWNVAMVYRERKTIQREVEAVRSAINTVALKTSQKS